MIPGCEYTYIIPLFYQPSFNIPGLRGDLENRPSVCGEGLGILFLKVTRSKSIKLS